MFPSFPVVVVVAGVCPEGAGFYLGEEAAQQQLSGGHY